MSETDMREVSADELEQVTGGTAGTKYIIYTVVKGDCLNKIAHHYNVTVDELVRWNKISNSRLILVGQKLKIYVK